MNHVEYINIANKTSDNIAKDRQLLYTIRNVQRTKVY